jgi:hypothetical protein
MADDSASTPARWRRGISVRGPNERAQLKRRSDAPGKLPNKLAHPQNRWQRSVRYVWDKKRG